MGDTDNENAPIQTESDETPEGDATTPETDSEAPQDDSDAFPREYVEKHRKESAGYRDKAKTAEERANAADVNAEALAQRLHTALVAATGKLQDPSDLPYAAAHLDDAEALSAAIDGLLESKPHLRARAIRGDIGQGRGRGTAEEPVNLLSMLKEHV